MIEIPSNIRGGFSTNHILAPYTSWRIGGAAQYFYYPVDLEDLISFLKQWDKMPIIFLGAGSNVLVRDGGINGLVIYLRDHLNSINQINNECLRVEAGVLLNKLVQKCADLSMIEAMFLAGIPGTVGGALIMNAGAHGDSIWNYVKSVETIDKHGNINAYDKEEFAIDYRHITPPFKEEWFVSCDLRFPITNPVKTREKMTEYLEKRRLTQPLDEPSCGSVFRNPKNDFAARLIELSGLKGTAIGDAQVSEKHANFIVNKGHATAFEVESLMQLIQERIFLQHGIKLIPEVRVLGENPQHNFIS